MISPKDISNIKIDESNIRILIEYREKMLNLNRLIKESFNKYEKHEISIALILPDIHKELDVLNKIISEYERRNPSCIKTKHYYKCVNLDGYSYANDSITYVYVKEKSTKNLVIDSLRLYKRDNYLSTIFEANKTASIIKFIDGFYNGDVVEISEDEYNRILNMPTVELLNSEY